MDPNAYSQILQVLATHCVICRAPLSDTESVSRGYGPICGAHYYNPLHIPTESMVKDALGLLAISNLPEHIIEGFLKKVNNDHTNARLGCNLLIYWASAHYKDREEVFKCSAIIRALGYVELADKLEIDRTVGHIEDKGDHLVAFVGYRRGFQNDMDRIPGIRRNDEKRGNKIGWIIPKDKEEHFLIALGANYGGELVCGARGIWKVPHRRRSDLFTLLNPPPPPVPAQVASSNMIQVMDGRVEISTPYNSTFILALKQQIPWQKRAWDGVKKCWRVYSECLEIVRGLVTTHFNTNVP